MSFSASEFIRLSAQANSDAAAVFVYRTAADNLAATKAANYFDDAAASTGGLGLKNDDVILVQATDGTSFLEVDVTAGAVTTTAANDFA